MLKNSSCLSSTKRDNGKEWQKSWSVALLCFWVFHLVTVSSFLLVGFSRTLFWPFWKLLQNIAAAIFARWSFQLCARTGQRFYLRPSQNQPVIKENTEIPVKTAMYMLAFVNRCISVDGWDEIYHIKQVLGWTVILSPWLAPCGLCGWESRPTPFPGRIS